MNNDEFYGLRKLDGDTEVFSFPSQSILNLWVANSNPSHHEGQRAIATQEEIDSYSVKTGMLCNDSWDSPLHEHDISDMDEEERDLVDFDCVWIADDGSLINYDPDVDCSNN